MRLTIINQFYVPDLSPTAHLAASLAEHRAGLGDEVTVVASSGGYVSHLGKVDSAGTGNPRIRRMWTPRLGKASALRRCLEYSVFHCLAACRTLMLPRQDVIVALTTPPFIVWAAVLHKLLHPRTRIVLWNMDCYPAVTERAGVIAAGGLASRIMRAVNRALFRRLDCVVCLDWAMHRLLQTRYSPPNRTLPFVVIPNWEKASAFPSNGVPQRHSRSRPSRAKRQFIILYTGNRGPAHDFGTVMEAAEALAGEPVLFLFVGGGSKSKDLKEQSQRRNLLNFVVQGYVSPKRLHALMAAADCALITLHNRMLGVVSPSKLHANLAMGLPVIYVGPEGGNVDHAIERFGCGVSLRQGDTSGLIDFIRKAMADPGSLVEYSAQARRAFQQAYCDTRTLPLLDAVIAGKLPADRTLDAPAPRKKAA